MPSDVVAVNRVTTRRVEPADRPLLEKWLGDPVIRAAIEDETILPSKPGETIELFEKSDPLRRGDLCLVLERGAEAIGLVHFAWINWISRNAEVVVFIGPPELRRSITALKALIELGDVAFRRLNLHKIYAFVYGANERSLSLFKRFMKPEARLKGYLKGGPTHQDVFILGMLASEYSRTLKRLKR